MNTRRREWTRHCVIASFAPATLRMGPMQMDHLHGVWFNLYIKVICSEGGIFNHHCSIYRKFPWLKISMVILFLSSKRPIQKIIYPKKFYYYEKFLL
ncbi:MAG TPA: hypothetical protein PKC30_05170 [Saprospiraceae bacterium]|nr:hypothetical protein [Saprospiraceae bacterium]